MQTEEGREEGSEEGRGWEEIHWWGRGHKKVAREYNI